MTTPYMKLLEQRHVFGEHMVHEWPVLHRIGDSHAVFVLGDQAVMIWYAKEQCWRMQEYGALQELCAHAVTEKIPVRTFTGQHAWDELTTYFPVDLEIE